jgi:pimeloyl-ACP methyl ester carboxylesterase
VLPAQADPPTDYGRFAQRTFNAYAEACRDSPACAQEHRDPVGDLERARAVVLAAWQDGTGKVSPGLFGELVRMELYGPGRIRGLFGALAQASAGDLSFWEGRAQRLLGVWPPQGLSLGMFLSVTCGDFMPAVDRARVERSSTGSFAGHYRFDQQAAACAEWPVPAAPHDFFEPVRAEVPTLLVSGQYDPVTPPEWGQMAAATLTPSLAVTIANNGHALGRAAFCVGDMALTLVETLDPARIDIGCADDLPSPFMSGD